jgi:hypothetical protein
VQVYAEQQLARLEGLGDKVVDSRDERRHTLLVVGRRGDEDHGNEPQLVDETQLVKELDARHGPHDEFGDDEVWLDCLDEFACFLGAGRLDHGTETLKQGLDVRAHLGVVVHDQKHVFPLKHEAFCEPSGCQAPRCLRGRPAWTRGSVEEERVFRRGVATLTPLFDVASNLLGVHTEGHGDEGLDVGLVAEWEACDEGRSRLLAGLGSRLRPNRELAVVQSHNLLDHGEADAGRSATTVLRSLDAVEEVGRRMHVGLSHTDTGVADDDASHVVGVR